MKKIVLFVIGLALITNVIAAEKIDISVFDSEMIHFHPDSASHYAKEYIVTLDNGRSIQNTVQLPEFQKNQKITGLLTLHPIPKDALSVYDSWDRAGNITLKTETESIELIKFITAYGGKTSYEVDLTHLSGLLTSSEITIEAFIDTWVSPGWKIDLTLRYEPTHDSLMPVWVSPVFYINSYTAEEFGKDGYSMNITVPENVKRVQFYYFVSGHCTDGRDADEFISKDNVISVDNKVVYRYQPWRDDCRDFRSINPYTKKWSAGYWSSDFSRSGWCPGDIVEPLVLDLTDHLTPGEHSLNLTIEDVRPKDDNNQYGYWRVSAYILGWDTEDIYKYNEDL